jgi:hypothetical protein
MFGYTLLLESYSVGPGSVHVVFLVDRVALAKNVFSDYVSFFPVSVSPRGPHTCISFFAKDIT